MPQITMDYALKYKTRILKLKDTVYFLVFSSLFGVIPKC